LLYAAQTDATPIVKSCLSSNNLATLTLAADCLDEALQLDAAVRQQVETMLIANLESDDPELFKLAAEVKLQRRLRNLQRIDENRDIDVTFISCAEYQLFLDNILGWEFHKPKHWKDFYSNYWMMSRFQKGFALKPVAGVLAKDAKAFCLWLHQKTGERYRLPRSDEVENTLHDEDAASLATWTYTNDLHELAWSSENNKKLITEKLQKISSVPVFLGDYCQNIDREINFSEHLKAALTFNCAFKHDYYNYINRIEFLFRFPDVLLNRILKFFTTSPKRNSKYSEYILMTIGIILLGTVVLESMLYGAISGAVISTWVVYRFWSANKHPQFQEILYLDLKIAKYAFGLEPEQHIFQKDMEELLKKLREVASSEFYKHECGKTAQAHLAQLIDALSKILEETPKSSLAKGEFFKLVTEYLYSRHEQTDYSSSWGTRLLPLRFRENIIKNSQDKQIILQLYWWFAIVTARQKGELPAWEGIRIVRERDV